MKVSVLVMTYDHAAFIRQALDGVLMQEASFDFEILVSEDCSTDGTREIVEEYARLHPDKIRLLLSETNIHTNAVVVRGVEAARGEYIALLDGDDYWLRTDKLQKQVTFLDGHPECAICFHNVGVLEEGAKHPKRNWTAVGHPKISTFEDIWFGNFIATCSTMFRRGVIPKIPDWYDAFFPITDWPLHILNAEHGSIGYIDEVMGVYRLHAGGLFSALSERKKLIETLKFYRQMNECLDLRHDRLARTAISKYFIEWVEEYLDRGDHAGARACFGYYFSGRPLNRHVSLKRMVSNALRIVVPAALLPRRLRRSIHE
jgi:glycosyltransferase involved in cell wall biosynthesis